MRRPGPVLITGASGGIGLATTLEAARRGWDVYATVRSEHNAQSVTDAAAREGLRVTVDVLDVTDVQQCESVTAKAQPYALINNAGMAWAGAIEETDIEAGQQQLEVMAVAPMRLSQMCLPFMRHHGGGRIVNVSSLGGRTAAPFTGWYVASKHALEALSDALRMELARDNIAVSLIEPGGVDTQILDKSVDFASKIENSRFTDGYQRAERLTTLTHKFHGTPERVANVIMNAVERPNPRARYVVGLDARLLLLAGKLFPTRIRDRFKRKALAI